MIQLTKKLLAIIFLFLFSAAVIISCGKKADSEADHPTEEQAAPAEEPADEHPTDSTEHPTDSTNAD
jgi:hypothetical protein